MDYRNTEPIRTPTWHDQFIRFTLTAEEHGCKIYVKSLVSVCPLRRTVD